MKSHAIPFYVNVSSLQHTLPSLPMYLIQISSKPANPKRLSPKQEKIYFDTTQRQWAGKYTNARTERERRNYVGYFLEDLVDLVLTSLGFHVDKPVRGSKTIQTTDMTAIKYYQRYDDLYFAVECMNSVETYSKYYIDRIRNRLQRAKNGGYHAMVVCGNRNKNFRYDLSFLLEPNVIIDLWKQYSPIGTTFRDYIDLKRRIRKEVYKFKK